MTSPDRLFQPLQIGNVRIQHRVSMAPLTRFRADSNHVPGRYAKEYYEQRASVPGTLIITEATFIAPGAGGYKNVPGIWNEDQVMAWREVTDAVHAKRSFIFCQLWALGRLANPKVLREEGNYPRLSSSADEVGLQQDNRASKVEDLEAMTENQIKEFVGLYANAARNAKKAGFDGVEIHGANGYLIDQFTREVVNHRNDEYGGSIENRSRFALDVTKAVIDAVGGDPNNVGIRLSPWYNANGMAMERPIPQFLHLAKKLKEMNLAYLHLVERRIAGDAPDNAEFSDVNPGNDELIEEWCKNGRPLLLAGGFTVDKASKLVNVAHPTKEISIAFGRAFIANPDLPFRIQYKIGWNPWDRSGFYAAEAAEGYIDQPFSAEREERVATSAVL